MWAPVATPLETANTTHVRATYLFLARARISRDKLARHPERSGVVMLCTFVSRGLLHEAIHRRAHLLELAHAGHDRVVGTHGFQSRLQALFGLLFDKARSL